MRYDVYRGLRKMKLINNDRRGNILRFNNSLKALLTQQHNLFEGFSIRYFGPVDGHDVNYMIKLLNDIKDLQGPKLLHIKTKKGKRVQACRGIGYRMACTGQVQQGNRPAHHRAQPG